MIISSIQATKNINHKIRKEIAVSIRLIRRCKLLRRSAPEPFCTCSICEAKEDRDKAFLSRGWVSALILLIALGIMCLFAGCATAQPLIVKIAESQIGKGEIGGDNKGPLVEKYTHGKEVAWCAGFVSWTIQKTYGKGPYLLSAQSYWKVYKGKRVRSPKAGDIICFYRGGRRSGLGHVGIVENVRGNRLTTIEGNVGPYPAKVKRLTYNLKKIPNLLGFVRVI